MPAPIVPAPSTPMTAGALSPRSGAPALGLPCRRSSADTGRLACRLSSGGHQRVDPRHHASDDELLDLRGSLIQGRHAHIAQVALDRMVVDIAGATVYLDG